MVACAIDEILKSAKIPSNEEITQQHSAARRRSGAGVSMYDFGLSRRVSYVEKSQAHEEAAAAKRFTRPRSTYTDSSRLVSIDRRKAGLTRAAAT